MYGDGMCPQTSFLIPSPRNTWQARSIGQGNAIIYQFALALFSLPNILLMKNESFHHGTATAKQSQRLSCRWDRFCTCGALWQHTAPSGLPGSSVAWLMNPHGRKFESRCLAKHWSWILLLGFIYPPIPESFCWAFQNLGKLTMPGHLLCHPHCKPAVLWTNRQRTLPSSAALVPWFRRWNQSV